MNRHLRLAKTTAESLGARVIKIADGKRHTELHIEGNGQRGILRIHRGSKVTTRAQTGLRANVRAILEGRA